MRNHFDYIIRRGDGRPDEDTKITMGDLFWMAIEAVALFGMVLAVICFVVGLGALE